MKLGAYDFSEKYGDLTFKDFKTFYEKGDFPKKTGVSLEDAATKLGIKVPKKNIKQGAD